MNNAALIYYISYQDFAFKIIHLSLTYLAAKMAILDKELAAKKSENDAKREKQDKEDLDRAQAELNSTRHEIKSIEEKITALRKFEAQFDQYLQQLNDSAIGTDHDFLSLSHYGLWPAGRFW